MSALVSACRPSVRCVSSSGPVGAGRKQHHKTQMDYRSVPGPVPVVPVPVPVPVPVVPYRSVPAPVPAPVPVPVRPGAGTMVEQSEPPPMSYVWLHRDTQNAARPWNCVSRV